MIHALPPLVIRPLCVGLFGGPLDRRRGPGEPEYLSAMFMFLIEGGASPVLVDTGTLDPAAARARQRRLLHRPPEMEPLAVLRAHGVEPEDVRIVVNTHLHWDHCSGNDLFPAATIYVQRAEVAHAVSPIESHLPFYEKLPGIRPAWLDAWDRIRAVDGDHDLAPGISLIALPGHSPGSQGVLVETRAGRFLIAGDTVNRFEDWEGDGAGGHTPPALIHSPAEWAASARRIEGLGCAVIPSHDLALIAHAPFGA
ncbi:N-acyl homoserine lactonase family protein [Microbacterium tumbae]